MVVGVVLAGCPAEDDDTGSAGALGTTTTQGSTSDSSSGESGSSIGTGASGSCADALDEAACASVTVPMGLGCTWLEVTAVSPDSCSPGETIALCADISTDPGCPITPGCDGDAMFLELDDGSIAPFVTCAGPSPSEARPCLALEDGERYDPPECGCVCDGSGTSTG